MLTSVFEMDIARLFCEITIPFNMDSAPSYANMNYFIVSYDWGLNLHPSYDLDIEGGI